MLRLLRQNLAEKIALDVPIGAPKVFQEAILLVSLKAMTPPAGVSEITAEYFRIRIWAAPFTLLGYAITGVLFTAILIARLVSLIGVDLGKR